MSKASHRYSFIAVASIFFFLAPVRSFAGEGPSTTPAPAVVASAVSTSSNALLPDAPMPQAAHDQVPPTGSSIAERFLNAADPGYLKVGDEWDITINRGEKVRPFTRRDKLQYAGEEELSPFTLLSASFSAGYEQLADANPHFGSDKAGFGERFGAAAFRQGTNRLFGDGILPALLHEDPRYYRVADGSLWYRGTRAAVQTLVRHRDDGSVGINYSGILGQAISNSLPLTFYPQSSAKVTVAASGFGTSLLADAGLKLVREFLPDAFRAVGLIPPNP